MPFTIVRDDITHVKADAIVNAANEHLWRGGGVCGAIFEAAGARRMQKACDKIGHCDTGSAVATPAFSLPAKYVIHAVGPVWSGGTHDEAELLASCYKSSLELAESLGCTSIAFPLISAGIYGYPRREALQIAQKQSKAFLNDHEMDITLVLYDAAVMELTDELRLRVASYIDDVYVGEHARRASRRPWENVQYPWTGPQEAEEDLAAEPLAQPSAEASMAPASGKAAGTICPRCGAPVGSDASFCLGCGYDLRSHPSLGETGAFQAFDAASAPAFGSAPAPRHTESAVSSAPMPAQAPRVGAAGKVGGFSLPNPLRNMLNHLDAGFSETLLALIDERGLKDSQVYKRANISRQHFSKMRSNPRYKPTKTTVLALAVALELSLEETSMLLERAGFALSHADRRDVIVEFFIREGDYDIFQINDVLFAYDQPLLG